MAKIWPPTNCAKSKTLGTDATEYFDSYLRYQLNIYPWIMG
jgi:hypothetical protein